MSETLQYIDSEQAVGEILKNGKLTLLYFTADWCGPCQQIKPVVAQIHEKAPNLNVYLIDVDKAQELAQKFEIKSMPTFFLFHQTDLLLRFSGADAEKLGMIVQVSTRLEQKLMTLKPRTVPQVLQPRKLE